MDARQLSRTAAERLPKPVVTLARSTVESFGTLTSPLRLSPSFLVVGAQRAGTTTMYRLLSDHPDVVRPTAAKGIGYFDLNYAKGSRWYRGHFPLTAVAERRLSGRQPHTFESSGYYLFHPLAAERIAHDLPGIRVIVMVRDPVERAYSAHSHELARGFETEPFERALELEDERLAGVEERLRTDPAFHSFEHRHHAYLARSRYAEQIERFIGHLGRERVLIVDADAFFAHPQDEFVALCAQLGLREWRPERVDKWNPRKRDTMDPQLRQRLMDHFAPHDEHLARLLGTTPSWRQAP